MFTLNDTQRALLAAVRAGQEEGERRFDLWSVRERSLATAEAFGHILTDSGLRVGQSLTAHQRDRLLRLATELAPNASLSRRLYQDSPTQFDARLRLLLFGDAPLPERLTQFLAPRGTGPQTAAQLLCAFDPFTYPLLTRAALRRLRLTAAQHREAVRDATERFGVPASGAPDAAQRLLGLFHIYEVVRDVLGETFYPQVDRLLRAEIPSPVLLNAPAGRIHETPGRYDSVPAVLTEARLLDTLEDYAAGQGFVFPPGLLRSYYVSLKTKPFAILAGVSGTGKTKLAELFAEAMTGHQPAQFRLLPVRPDWADSSPLLGYFNLLANRYVPTPFLDLARAAARPENRHRAYFVCLDEMNLARVEHYLADYLSALEARGHRIPLHTDVPDLILPPNLFVTGTVNVDETTHAFSRKVLDRANTLSFDAPPRLQEGLSPNGKGRASPDEDATPAQRQSLFLGARIVTAGRARERLAHLRPDFPDRALAALESVNALLYPERFHFGYRVRDEVLMFLANSFDAETGEGLLRPEGEENFRRALDLQVTQKVLPKLNGAAEMLDPLLAQLAAWAEAAHLPLTAAKLARMRAQGTAAGFVQFYE